MNTKIRSTIKPDVKIVMDIINRTNFFRPTEAEIALEVLEAATEPDSSYQSYVALIPDKIAGWVCFGATPCTLGTFDIYWIAVDPDIQRRHIGSLLLDFTEKKIAGQKGRLIIIETSGAELYVPTQRFYKKNGYELKANVTDFYAPGDPKLIFTKPVARVMRGP